MNINKEQFITQFVAAWLAAWSVKEYDTACFYGNHKKLNTPPVEDALFLAEKSYEELKNMHNIPRQVVQLLLEEAWPNKNIIIVNIKPWDSIHPLQYYTVYYGIKDENNIVTNNVVSYSYSLHILPKIIEWRNKQLDKLI